MSTYKGIFGKTIKHLSSDPDNSTYEGQIWYNTTEGKFKTVVATAATSSGSSVIEKRKQSAGGGTQTDSFIAGGTDTANVDSTEEYNGSGFSTGGNLGTSRRAFGGTGSTPAGLVFGGFATAATGDTEEYNGTSWSEQNNLNTTRYALASANSSPQTAALAFGGYTTTQSNSTEEYDGTSWTASSNLNVATHDAAGAGTQTAGLLCGGSAPSNASSITELYDGSSWTSSGTLNLGRQINMAFGTQTSAVTVGGIKSFSPDVTTDTIETFDGSTWTTSPATLATARAQSMGVGSPTAGVIASGATPTVTAVTEEYNFTANTVTAAAWASGGNMNTARRSMFTGQIGAQTAALAAGGYVGPARSQATEEYDGATWTTGNNTTDTLNGRGGHGTQTAGLLSGGLPGPVAVTDTEEYDGTNWTAGGALNSARGFGPIAAGTQTAALAAGGYNGTAFVTSVEFYNGSTWTTQPNTNQNNYAGASGGDQTAAWYIGAGQVTPAPLNIVAYNWDGTSWTSSGSYSTTSVVNMFGGGPQTQGWMCGGDADPGLSSNTNHYDGSVWSTAPNLGDARGIGGSAGTASAGLIFGGDTPGNTTATEEFTGETTGINIESVDNS